MEASVSLMDFDLTGTRNFRSLKGLPTADGRVIAGHTIVRSDQLDLLVESDWSVLRSLGIKTVCDLRSESERARYPNSLPGSEMSQLSMEVMNDIRSDPNLIAALKNRPDEEGAVNLMLEVYRKLPVSLAPHLSTMFDLFRSNAASVLIHCTAGKDRTGFAVAVLLHALGVRPDAIMDDYLLSGRTHCISNPVRRLIVADIVNRLAGKKNSESMIDTIMDAREIYLQTAFNSVVSNYGSMDAYIQTHTGLDAENLRALRDQYLTVLPNC
jgi:protein-tyrosine phosphatase